MHLEIKAHGGPGTGKTAVLNMVKALCTKIGFNYMEDTEDHKLVVTINAEGLNMLADLMAMLRWIRRH